MRARSKQPATIFVINLDEDRERLAAMDRRLGEIGLSYTRFAGFRGLNLPGWLRDQFLDAEGRVRPSMNEGQVGCYASHLGVCREIIDRNIEGPVLVLEDDLGFEPEFRGVIANLHKLPEDWDIVRCSTQPKSPFVPVGRLTELTEVVRYWRIPMLSTAYFINRRGAERILFAKSRRIRPVDSDLRRFWEFGLQTYGLVPIPIRRLDGASSVERIAIRSKTKTRSESNPRDAFMVHYRARLRVFGPWLSLRCAAADLRTYLRGRLAGVKRSYSPSLRIATGPRSRVPR